MKFQAKALTAIISLIAFCIPMVSMAAEPIALSFDMETGTALQTVNAEKRFQSRIFGSYLLVYTLLEQMKNAHMKVNDNVVIQSGETSKSARLITVKTALIELIEKNNQQCLESILNHLESSRELFVENLRIHAQSFGFTSEQIDNPRNIRSITVTIDGIRSLLIQFKNRYPYVFNDIRTEHDEPDATTYAFVNRNHRSILNIVCSDNAEINKEMVENLERVALYDYTNIIAIQKEIPVVSIPIENGKSTSLKLGTNRDVLVSLPVKELRTYGENGLKLTATVKLPVYAPIKKGQQIGLLHPSYNGKILPSHPLYALKDVRENSRLHKYLRAIELNFQKNE